MLHLNDPNTYQALTYNNITQERKETIINKLTKLHKQGILLTTWFDFCKPPHNHRTSILHFLKKIYKQPMGNRPKVSSCESITENIAKFVDKWLQPHVQNLPSYIKDTTEFINLIERTNVRRNGKLASIDISSLYTNIPHKEGIQNAMYFLKNNPNNYRYPEQPSPEIIGELIELVLTNNIFEFNNKHYKYKVRQWAHEWAPSYAKPIHGQTGNPINKNNTNENTYLEKICR